VNEMHVGFSRGKWKKKLKNYGTRASKRKTISAIDLGGEKGVFSASHKFLEPANASPDC